MAPPWIARYADLTGKTAIVAGDDAPVVVEVVRALAANGVLVAVVASDRDLVDSAAAVADGLEAQVFAMSADPGSDEVWSRVVPHVEQRLGPIDLVVTVGDAASRGLLAAAVTPDMAARGRGVVIEVGPDPAAGPTDGVRRRHVVGGAADAIAAGVLLCASDTMTAATARLELQG